MNDKEGRKWLLQKLYDRGFKYIFHSGGLGGYIATKQQPETLDNHTYIAGSFERIDVLSDLIPDFNEPNYLDIGKYLGIVDWSKIPVDTPIIADTACGMRRRYFAKYDGGKVWYFCNGMTSWSSKLGMITDINPCKVRLAGGNDEN
ncbi:hypothetical protein [uncultured Veillonella sp.]|uniref:hypothetical protein n=1 Tax=uncultured Veillonella sp. TaxID=159268 RepID=UPI00262BADAC|nr:hypothetical protein [uncultured Veillonella sp.]